MVLCMLSVVTFYVQEWGLGVGFLRILVPRRQLVVLYQQLTNMKLWWENNEMRKLKALKQICPIVTTRPASTTLVQYQCHVS